MLGQMAMNLLRKAQTVRSEDLVRSDSDGEILASTHCDVEACAQTSYGNGAHVSADNKTVPDQRLRVLAVTTTTSILVY